MLYALGVQAQDVDRQLKERPVAMAFSLLKAPDVDGQVYITAGRADVGDIVSLKITDSSEYDLIGEIVDEQEH